MSYAELAVTMGEINDLLNAKSVLSWDSRTMMPPGGAATRSKQIATLVVSARRLLLSKTTRRLLDAAEAEVASLADDSVERAMTSQVREAIDYHSRIPETLLQQVTELGAFGQSVWAKARAESDFPAFVPVLERTVDLNRQMADAIGYADHPYDALMYRFEPGETVASLKGLFAALKDGLLPLVKAIADRPEPRTDFLARDYPKDKQLELVRRLAGKLGYDFQRGRLDTTVHPFEISFTRNDVRITTRFNPHHLPMSLFGGLHETGHALYEQGVDEAYTRTPFATDLIGFYAVGGVSYGAHESQSRLWENRVARSREFWDVNFDEARSVFPDQLGDISVDTFFRAINRAKPGLIRVEADELTYDFHVMLRVEIEQQLIDGSLKVGDLPEAWNAAMKAYLGLDVPDDARGVLQDVHWSAGEIGTFCNYTIGNVMAGQIYETASADPEIAAGLGRGDYAPLRQFLTENIYRHGRRYPRNELLRRLTGRPLDPKPYISQLTSKYSDVYGL